jgi:hypothetical protein
MGLGRHRDELRAWAAGFEPGTLTGAEAVSVVEVAQQIENLARLIKARAARRVTETDTWQPSGATSAKEYPAGKTGASAGQVGTLVDAAAKLDGLGATRDAAEAGAVSLEQASVIASAVAASPGCEQTLLDTACTKDLAELKHEAAKAKAAADRDEGARHERLRRQRRLRTWVDDEGMGNVSWRTTVDEYQEFLALHQRFRDDAFRAAYRGGRRDPDAHLASDAMLRLVRAAAGGGDGSTVRKDVRVLVHVTDTAVLRGHTEPGETCEVTGVGPVPVAVARTMIGTNPFVSLIETDGVDVRRVVRLGRRRPPEVDDALLVRDRWCVVPGCGSTWRLEVHHTIPFAESGRTTLDELATVCHHHHDLITHRGFALRGGPGRWTWHPPGSTATATGDRSPLSSTAGEGRLDVDAA